MVSLLGFSIGNYLTRSTVYEFMLNRKVSLIISQIIVIGAYLIMTNVTYHLTGGNTGIMMDSIVYFFIISIFMGIPGGIVYSSTLYKCLGGKKKDEVIDLGEMMNQQD